MRRTLKFILYSALSGILIFSTFIAILYLGGFGKIPSKQDLADLKNENASLVYANNGEVIGKYFSENRTNVSYEALPEHLIQALIATEDARFYEHEGVDPLAMIRVLIKSILLQDRSAGGGSTLSQQLAKNLFGRKDYGKISLGVNKLKEMILANRLENLYNKEDIIALYFNTVPFGENTYGIEVAAQRYFSVSVAELKIEQAAVLVGMLKANSRYNPRLHPEEALQRRAIVFSQMNKYGYLADEKLDSLNHLDLELKYNNISLNEKAPYYLHELKKELEVILLELEKETGEKYNFYSDGLKIYSSLNLNLQQASQKAMESHLAKMQVYMDRLYSQGASKRALVKLAEKVAKRSQIPLEDKRLKKRNLFSWDKDWQAEEMTNLDSLIYTLKQLHAGILGLNPKTGAIETWVGGINYSLYPYDQVLAKRQLASTFKPFLYADALANGKGLCDYLSNEPVVLNDYEDWSPQNYDGESGGYYSLAASLANSKNLPTVHLYFEAEPERLAKLWNDLGFLDKLNEGPSVILGTNSVSMLELAVAYSAFANGGKIIEPYAIERIETAEGKLLYEKDKKQGNQILDQKVSEQINAILSKAINEGTGRAIRSQYGIRIPLAGKTGTSQDFADAWFVCYNPKLLMISRVGASYPNIHFNSGNYGSGSKLALPLVALSLKEALKDREFQSKMQRANFSYLPEIDCPDFKEAGLIDQLFDSFKSKKTNLKKEQKRAKRKKKVKGFFKSIFGDKEDKN